MRKETEMKPARRFIAQAVVHDRGGFAALWAAPGMVPGLVRSPEGAVEQFRTPEEAEAAAMRRTFDVLNKPREKASGSAPERYRKLNSAEFAAELAAASITPTYFSFLYGTSQKRVLAWIDGSEAVPHPVRILLAIFRAFPKALDLAEEITEKFTTERKPRRTD